MRASGRTRVTLMSPERLWLNTRAEKIAHFSVTSVSSVSLHSSFDAASPSVDISTDPYAITHSQDSSLAPLSPARAIPAPAASSTPHSSAHASGGSGVNLTPSASSMVCILFFAVYFFLPLQRLWFLYHYYYKLRIC